MSARLTKAEKKKLNPSEKLIKYMRENPAYAAKVIFKVELTWFQILALYQIWMKTFVLILMGRGIGKTWLGAVAVCLYAILFPRTKIGIIAPVFRQAGYFFDYIQEFYDTSELFRACCKQKPQRNMNREFLQFVNGSYIEGLPLGDGNKIRGRRYNFVWVDEYAQVPEDIIKLVIRPFLNIKKKGVDNKLVISSTAFYAWNHFYSQYLFFNAMIRLKPLLFGLVEYTYLDLIKIKDSPYQVDMNILNMSKADSTEEQFNMENLCVPSNCSIYCEDNVKQIPEIIVGDKVLSGNGNFEKVTEVHVRPYVGDMYKIKVYGKGEYLEATPGHPVFVYRNGNFQYIEIKEILTTDYLATKIPNFINADADVFEAYILGLYLAEGNICIRKRLKKYKRTGYTITFAFHKNEDNLIRYVEKFFQERGINTWLRVEKNCVSVFAYINGFNRKKFKKFEDIGANSFNKKIPSYVFKYNKKCLKSFIKGLFDGDGYITKEKIEIDLASKNVIQQLNILLYKLGIQPNIYKLRDAGERICSGLKCNVKETWRLNTSAENANLLSKVIGCGGIEYSGKRKYHFIKDGHVCYRIKEICKYRYDGIVYNLEVENDNSYITTVNQVHNCLFPIGNSGFFTARLIENCTPKRDDGSPIELKGRPDRQYVMGVDVARVEAGADFVIQILRLDGNVKRLVYTKAMNGASYPDMADAIRRCFSEFNIVRFFMDSQGGGLAIYDILRQGWQDNSGKSMLPIIDMEDKDDTRPGLRCLKLISGTAPLNTEMFHGLKSEMEHARLLFPITMRRDSINEIEKVNNDINQTKQQLIWLIATALGNYFKFEVPTGKKKDRAVALALANMAAKDYLTVLKAPAPTLPVGVWV